MSTRRDAAHRREEANTGVSPLGFAPVEMTAMRESKTESTNLLLMRRF